MLWVHSLSVCVFFCIPMCLCICSECNFSPPIRSCCTSNRNFANTLLIPSSARSRSCWPSSTFTPHEFWCRLRSLQMCCKSQRSSWYVFTCACVHSVKMCVHSVKMCVHSVKMCVHSVKMCVNVCYVEPFLLAIEYLYFEQYALSLILLLSNNAFPL